MELSIQVSMNDDQGKIEGKRGILVSMDDQGKNRGKRVILVFYCATSGFGVLVWEKGSTYRPAPIHTHTPYCHRVR